MKKLLFLIVLLPLSVNALYITATVLPYDVLNDLNVYRKQHNLQPLKKSQVLCDLATRRTEEIKTDWSHSQFQKEINKIPYTGTFHENLARGYKPNNVVWAWSMSKAGHKEAMLIPNMDYGCVIQSGGYYTFEGYISDPNETVQ